jgi:hypothetical protein
VKEIIGKLVLWLKSSEKSLKTLIEHIKLAIISFASKLKNLLVSTTDSILTTIATAIIGPVVGVIKKTITLLKQGWQSLKEAIQYLRAPENKGKPLSYLLPQVGIIVVTGLSGIGAIVLGEFIEKALMSVPFLAVEIPLLGSPANLIGMLMGAIVCGVIGAIAINLINKHIANQQKADNLDAQIETRTEIIGIQNKLIEAKETSLEQMQREMVLGIVGRHGVVDEKLGELTKDSEDAEVAELSSMNNEELSRLLQKFKK